VPRQKGRLPNRAIKGTAKMGDRERETERERKRERASSLGFVIQDVAAIKLMHKVYFL